MRMKRQVALLVVGFLVLLGAVWSTEQHNSSALVDGKFMTTTKLYWNQIGVGLCGVGVFLVVYILRGRLVLKRWARANGFQILKSEITSSFAGSFTWNYGQIIYFVRVRDQDGKTRDGWVKCGSFYLGVWSNKTATKWKGEV